MYEPTAPIYPTLTDITSNLVSGSSTKTATLGPVPTKYECPLCLNYLLPPIYQCFNGHTLCSSCESKVKRCPSCREDLPTKKIRSLVLEELVVGLKFNCQNKHLGCSVKNLKFSQINDHALNCLFVEIPYCEQLNLNCKERFTGGHIIAHLKSAHQITGVDFECQGSDPFVEVFQGLPDSKLKRNKKLHLTPHYLKWKDKAFFVKTNIDAQEKYCSWMICMAGGSESSASDFVGSIKLTSKASSTNSLEWRGEIATLVTRFGFNEFTFSVPFKTLEMFTTRNKAGMVTDIVDWIIQVRLMKRFKPPLPSSGPSVTERRQQCSKNNAAGTIAASLLRENGIKKPLAPPVPSLGQAITDSTGSNSSLETTGENTLTPNKSTPPPVPTRPLKPKQSPVLVSEVMDSPKIGFVDKFCREILALESTI